MGNPASTGTPSPARRSLRTCATVVPSGPASQFVNSPTKTADAAAEVAPLHQVGEHAVDAVGALADVLDEQHAPARDWRRPAAAQACNMARLPPTRRPLARPRRKSLEPRDRALARGRLECRDPLLARGFARCVERAHHRTVNRGHPTAPRFGVEHREIRETHQPARPLQQLASSRRGAQSREPIASRAAITAWASPSRAR